MLLLMQRVESFPPSQARSSISLSPSRSLQLNEKQAVITIQPASNVPSFEHTMPWTSSYPVTESRVGREGGMGWDPALLRADTD